MLRFITKQGIQANHTLHIYKCMFTALNIITIFPEAYDIFIVTNLPCKGRNYILFQNE